MSTIVRSRAFRLALAAVPLWLTVATFILNTPWRLKLPIAFVFATTLVSPTLGLLAVAVLAPLGRLVETYLHLVVFRMSEAFVLAFLSGWLIRGRDDRAGPTFPAAAVAWLFGATVVASVVVQAWLMRRSGGALADAVQALFLGYYMIPDEIGFMTGARLVEGLALMAATIALLRTSPRLAVTLPAALTIAAVVAAAAAVLASRGIGAERILSEQALAPTGRISAFVPDVNAGGSYFAMMVFIALGMAARRLSGATMLWIPAAATAAYALWLTGSRTAIAATAIALPAAILWAAVSRCRLAIRRALLVVLAAAALTAGIGRTYVLREDLGATLRQQFNATSVRMMAARPFFGVGVGQYYPTSALFLDPEPAWIYGVQNAHNFFLQIGAELGAVGLALFIAVLGSALWRGGAALLQSSADWRLLGCIAGVLAFLATCLFGHPLLLDEVAAPFWILLGLTAGLGGSVLIGTSPHTEASRSRTPSSRTIAMVATAAVLIGVLMAIEASRPLVPLDTPGVNGLEPWESASDGTRFRWTRDYASVFVPRNVTRVYIPVRLPVDTPRLSPMGVDVHVAGRGYGRTLVGSSWTMLNVELPPAPPLQRFKRIDMKTDRTWQPGVYIPGSADLRAVGVQVGEVKLFYEY